MPAAPPLGFTLWNVRGQGRSYKSGVSINSCRSGLARESGVRSCTLECSRPRPLLQPGASIRSCRSELAREFGVGPCALENSRPRPLSHILVLRGTCTSLCNGRAYKSGASTKSCRSGLARESGVGPCALEYSRPRPLLQPGASIRSCRSGLARESGVRSCALECSRPRPLLQIRGFDKFP